MVLKFLITTDAAEITYESETGASCAFMMSIWIMLSMSMFAST